MDGDKAVLVESIRNAGSVPVTVSGVFADPQTLLDVHAQFQPDVYTDGLGIGGLDHRTTDTVTLAPEHEAGLVLTVTARPCSKRTNGPMLFGGVSVVTRTLGITTTQLIFFTDPYLIVPGLGPGRTCVEDPNDSQP